MPVKFGKTIIRFWFFLSYLITTVPRLCYVPKHRNRTLMTFLKPPGTNSRHISKITKSVPNKHFEMLLETKSSIIHEFPQNFPKYKKLFSNFFRNETEEREQRHQGTVGPVLTSGANSLTLSSTASQVWILCFKFSSNSPRLYLAREIDTKITKVCH